MRALATALRRLSDDEVAQLGAMLLAALDNCEGSPLTFIMTLSIADERPVLVVSSEFGGQFEAPGVGSVNDVFRILVASGVARAYAPSQAQASANDMPSAEGIVLERELAEFTLSLLIE